MATPLLTRVKSKLFIPTQRKSLSILEGEYRSLAFGRSTDFEDLREYEAGDDIKDIDWKATARSGTPLLRRYIASRRHTLMLVADTGKNMQAIAPSGEPKHELVTLALGVLGYLAVQHTDSVGTLYGDAEHTAHIKPKATESHLEHLLQAIHHQTIAEDAGASSITVQLDYIARNYPSRMILAVAADDFEVNEPNLALLRLLRTKHDLIWLSAADADPIATLHSDGAAFDILDRYEIPKFIKKDKTLLAHFAATEQERKQEMNLALDGVGVPHVELDDSKSVVGKLISLLEGRRKHRGL